MDAFFPYDGRQAGTPHRPGDLQSGFLAEVIFKMIPEKTSGCHRHLISLWGPKSTL
jgi:hypothetical protein